jgi:hypothetical protein
MANEGGGANVLTNGIQSTAVHATLQGMRLFRSREGPIAKFIVPYWGIKSIMA